MKRILVVCTANICRSPMVEGLLRARLQAACLGEEVSVESVGVFATDGRAVSPYSVLVLADKHIDISGHVSRGLDASAINRADVILVMEEAHRRSIFHRSPENLHKVLLYSELANEHDDVDDPYGLSKEAYEEVLYHIERILDIGWTKLLRRLGVSEVSVIRNP